LAANADRPGAGIAAPPVAAGDAGAELCVDVLVARAGGLADRPLTYCVPPALRPFAAVGMRARVPLGARRALGFVLGTSRRPAGDARSLRAVLDFPDDAPLFSPALLALAREIAGDTLSSLRDAVRCLVPPEVFGAPVPVRPRIAVRDVERPLPPRLGRRQTAVLAALSASAAGVPIPELVRVAGSAALRRLVASGVVRVREIPRLAPAAVEAVTPGPPVRPLTGGADGQRSLRPVLVLGDSAGRGERLARAAAATVRGGQRVLVVVPEIADASAVAERLADGTGASLAVLHSGLSAPERRAAWTRARSGRVDIVVGTRSALFTPLPRLGLIVLDDEPNAAYKSDAAPRYHARDVACRRARLEGTRLMLGAAAPSVEMYAAAAAGDVALLRVPARRPRPAVSIVDMRAEERRGHIGYLSRALVQGISRHLRARGGVVLLVSRRGYARVLLCRECGAAVRCSSCGVAMAYERDGAAVRCGVCGRAGPAPDLCPRCGGVGLRGVGAGTKRIEEVVRRLFPALQMGRLDSETPRADHVSREFAAGRVRLLVGTAMVLHALSERIHPTLVGVVDADGPLYVPDFRAAEHTLQHLRAAVQLVGQPAPAPGTSVAPSGVRAPAAGRQSPEVIVQTRVPDHPVLRAIRTGNDVPFYDAELAARRELGYPPHARLVRVVVECSTPDAGRTFVERVAAAARAHRLEVLGPAPLRGQRGAGLVRAQCVLRLPGRPRGCPGPRRDATLDAVRAALAEVPAPAGARLVVDVDPQEMM
jgi:primosomal protein N' (replication factor Y) (superfamily II helicase)